jgi:hypothetical protein
MDHRIPKIVSPMHRAAVRRSAVASMAAVVSISLVGCGSSSTDTGKATALFRQTVERSYDIHAGRCAPTAPSRWTCTAHINNPGREIDVDVYSTVRSVDGTLSAYGHTVVR